MVHTPNQRRTSPPTTTLPLPPFFLLALIAGLVGIIYFSSGSSPYEGCENWKPYQWANRWKVVENLPDTEDCEEFAAAIKDHVKARYRLGEDILIVCQELWQLRHSQRERERDGRSHCRETAEELYLRFCDGVGLGPWYPQ